MQNSNRLVGIDMAYAISIIGIVFYLYVFNTSNLAIQQGVLSHSWFIVFLDIFPAIFFFLNGMTISLTMRDRKVSSRKLLSYLPKRGMIMMLIGFAVCVYWPMNIFIASGMMYFVAPYIIQWNNMILRILIIAMIVIGHSLLFIHVPSSIHYSVPEIHGGGIIDLTGFLFFNGYFSVIPWFSFFVAGIVFGRSELRARGWFPPSSMIGLAFIGFGAVLHFALKKVDVTYFDLVRFDNPIVNLKLLLPAFVLASIGMTMILINFGNYFFKQVQSPLVTKFITVLTSMKYSVLLFQLLISSLTIILTPGAFFAKMPVLLGYSLGAGLLTLYLPFFWTSRISNKGPLEWVFKRVSGSAKK